MILKEYPIGFTFTLKRGKRAAKACTVEDIHKTYNSAGELVKVRYVISYAMLGQKVTDYDVPKATIDLAVA